LPQVQLFNMKYLFLLLILATACSSPKERLESEWNDHKKDLAKLNTQLKLKSDSFQHNRALANDTAFRKRVEWLTGDIQNLQVRMDTVDAKLKRLDKGNKKEEPQEKGG
jgi:septal ring factor EnvC (AmiA/AmiB activator)